MAGPGSVHTTATIDEAGEPIPPIRWRNLAWVGLAVLVMVGIVRLDQHWPLNFLHVISGVLWTGIDLFLGFVVGPIIRSMPFPARRALIGRLVPRVLFIMPTLSITTGTTGWFLARQGGYLNMTWPAFGWVAAALAIIAVLTIEGLAILLPTNLLVYLELRKPRPDGDRIGRLMRRYIFFTSTQGVLQVAIILVMARFVTGL